MLLLLLLFPILTFGIYDYPFDTPTKSLKEIHTKNFIIIYSDSSRDYAYNLAIFAEDELKDLEKTYGDFILPQYISNQKIRVIVSADIQTANGFASALLFPTIQLFVKKPPPSFVSHSNIEKDPLRMLFRHELTHILNITVREYFPDSLLPNFINYNVVPSAIFASRSFLEGAAIARESDNGYGRLNDPYLYHLMRRDLLDTRFPTFSEFGGASTRFEAGALPYTYGALFNQFLSQNIEKYQDLDFWKNTGQWKISSWALKNVTKQKQKTLWNNFVTSLVPKVDYSINTNYLLSKDDRRINSIQYQDGKIYYFNTQNKTFRQFNLITEKDSIVTYGNQSWNKVIISGNKLLVSGYVSGSANNNKTFVRVVDKNNLLSLSKTYWGFDDANFLDDGRIIAINRNTTYNAITILNGEEEQNIYTGSSINSFDSPVEWGDYIYFIHQYDGRRILSRIKKQTRELSSLENNKLQHIRFLTKDTEGLSISYVDDKEGFYKRALVRDDGVIFIQDNIKGEIFDSIEYKGNLYYKSSFSRHDNLMKISLQDLTTFQDSSKIVPLKEVPTTLYTYTGIETPYKLRRDLASINIFPLVSLDNAGIQTLFQDSLGANLINTKVLIEYERGTPEFSLSWQNQETPFTFSTAIYNLYQRIFHTALNTPHLLLGVGFSGSYTKNFANNSFSIFGDLTWQGRFIGALNLHPYQWNNLASQQLVGGIGLFWSNITSEGKFGFSRFIDLYIKYAIDFNNINSQRIEGRVRFSPPVLPITLSLYGIYDTSLISIYGTSLLGASRIPIFREYTGINILSKYAFFSTIEILLYSWEIQKGVGFGELFFHRWSFYTGYRAGYWGQFLQSVYLNTSLDFSLLYGNLPLSIEVEVNYAISINKWGYSYGLKVSLPI